MRKLLGLGIAAAFAIGLFSTPAAAQYQSCEVWKQDCARYYGWGNGNWQNCMGQPGALAACGRGGYYGGSGYQGGGYAYRRPAQSCAVWKQDCARYYGWGNVNWQNCMGQPGAIAACGGGYGGY